MGTGFKSKLGLASVIAVGLYVPTMGLPLPLKSCLQTVGVANSAPSPTCASDLRDCLQGSVKTGLYGVRYVTADDVARCMEAFNRCTSGGKSQGGNTSPPKSTSAGGDGRKGLPQHFGITVSSNLDCRVNGNAVKCNGNPGHPDALVQMDELTGTLSGLTLTGIRTRHMELPGSGSCPILVDHSAPVSITFNLDGTAGVSDGPNEVSVASGCREPAVNTIPAEHYTQTWSALP